MRKLYAPKLVKGFSTCIYGIFLPENTLYMRTNNGYMWVSAWDVVNCKGNKFVVDVLTTNAKFPRKMRIRANDGLGLLFTQAVEGVQVEKPVAVVNRQTLGDLAPKNVMVSKAYAACAVYADAKETKTKKSIEWRM